MVLGIFGRREKAAAPTYEDLTRSAVRFIVSNGFQVRSGEVERISKIELYRSLSPEEQIARAVAATAESFRNQSLDFINYRMESVKDQLLTDFLVASITEELIDEAVNAARGRALVKGFRAGLEHSEAYMKLMDAQSVKEVEVIERWIERSDAYRAIAQG